MSVGASRAPGVSQTAPRPSPACGPRGTDSYVLGEINVSSVFPIPDEAPAEIARRVADRLRPKL